MGDPRRINIVSNGACTFASDEPITQRRLKKRNIVVLIPAYNEERFIGSLVLKLQSLPVTVVVVDDGSKDDTAEIAERAGAIVVRQPENRGKAEALNAGFQVVQQLNPEAVVTIDADLQHNPEELPRLVQPILEGQADIVIGSRYMTKSSQVPAHRIFGHIFFRYLTNWISGTRVSDTQSGYRAFSPNACHYLFHSSGFTVESEMQFIAREHKLRILEVPVSIRYDDKPKRSVWQQGLDVLAGILKLTGQYRPLLFFGVPGTALLLAGMALGVWVVERFKQVGELPVGFAILCVLLSVLGLIMLSTGFTLHSVRGLIADMLKDIKRR
ncbi:MAG: glycosyltransferase family 2 protein [Anaerolineales bacterium]